MANYLYGRPNQRYLPMRDEFKGTWEVGVVMQFDIWNWGTTAHQTAQASSQLHQHEYMLAQMEDNATLEVKRSRLGVERAINRIDVAQEAIAQSDQVRLSLADQETFAHAMIAPAKPNAALKRAFAKANKLLAA